MAGANGLARKSGPMRPKATERRSASGGSEQRAAVAMQRIDRLLDEDWQTSIKTHKVFGAKYNDEAFSPAEMRRINAEIGAAPVRSVALRGGFIPNQTNLHVQNLRTIVSRGRIDINERSDKLPQVVIRKNGERHVFDGHHRVAAAMLLGDSKIKARVYRES
ncbi:hypothetical protein [Sorangium sp. So ce233]|uniref:hypothetical protein n=1 Tax=Sorangium sp. So ce233 TaxID=3133290 RepID=UPI003F647D9A